MTRHPDNVAAAEDFPMDTGGGEDITPTAGIAPDGMTWYRVGDPWTGSGRMELPPGDSFGLYWQGVDGHPDGGGGLFLLVACQNMTPTELDGWTDGGISAFFGTTPGGLLVGAFYVDGFGWCDVATGHHTEQDFTASTGAMGATRWATGGGHGTVAGVVVNRTRNRQTGEPDDHIAALRYFTLSPDVTRYVGGVLADSYAGPAFTEETYTADVLAWQAANPHTATWANSRVAVPGVWCMAGD